MQPCLVVIARDRFCKCGVNVFSICLAVILSSAVKAVIIGVKVKKTFKLRQNKPKMEKKSRTGRITKVQKGKLIDIMKGHNTVAIGTFGGPNSAKTASDLWESVAVELNAIGGAKKSAEQWKKCWADWKCTVKKQQSKINRFHGRTGNLPESEGPAPLEDIDMEVLQFIPKDAVEGDGSTKESGFTQIETKNMGEEDNYSLYSLGSTPPPQASTSRSRDKTLDTPKPAKTPKSSTSKTFSSSFEEVKQYMKAQDEERMKVMNTQTELLKDILDMLKSIDESLRPRSIYD